MIWATSCSDCRRKFRRGSLTICRACGGRLSGMTLLLPATEYSDDEFPEVFVASAPVPDVAATAEPVDTDAAGTGRAALAGIVIAVVVATLVAVLAVC